MKDIMKILLDEVSKGKQFHIDLKNHSIKVDKKYLIKKGVIQNGYCIKLSDDDPYEIIEQNYKLFKYSQPDKNFKKSYFKAKSEEELTDKEFINGNPRSITQAILEGYIVCAAVVKHLYWKNPEHWYWVSEKDNDLIILKRWAIHE